MLVLLSPLSLLFPQSVRWPAAGGTNFRGGGDSSRGKKRSEVEASDFSPLLSCLRSNFPPPRTSILPEISAPPASHLFLLHRHHHSPLGRLPRTRHPSFSSGSMRGGEGGNSQREIYCGHKSAIASSLPSTTTRGDPPLLPPLVEDVIFRHIFSLYPSGRVSSPPPPPPPPRPPAFLT